MGPPLFHFSFEWKFVSYRPNSLLLFLKHIFYLAARGYLWILLSSQIAHFSHWELWVPAKCLRKLSRHSCTATATAALGREHQTKLVRWGKVKAKGCQPGGRLCRPDANEKSLLAEGFPVCHSTQCTTALHSWKLRVWAELTGEEKIPEKAHHS